MAKASKAFFGNDTFGRSLELAQSVSGAWFVRFYEWNGFAKAWSKWEATEDRALDTHYTDAKGERIAYGVPRMFWGFNVMREYNEIPRFRLPA